MSACDIIRDIISDTGQTVFIQQPQVALWVFEPCACTWYMISPMTSYTISFYDSTYDIVYNNIVWYHTIWFHIWYHIIWNHIWYHSMISHMISYKWYHMSGASVLMHRTYDTSIWYHSIWYHRGVPFFLDFFWISMHEKKYKTPLGIARTRILVCSLKGSHSDSWTNGSLSCIICKSLV